MGGAIRGIFDAISIPHVDRRVAGRLRPRPSASPARPRSRTRTCFALPASAQGDDHGVPAGRSTARIELMTRLEATRTDRRARGRRADRREPRPSRLRPVRRRRSAAELLHLGQHGTRLVGRPRPRPGAARLARHRARRRRLAADEPWFARDDRPAAAGEPGRHRDGQRGICDDRRSADADRARRRPRGGGARDGDTPRPQPFADWRRAAHRARIGARRRCQGRRIGADREAAARLRVHQEPFHVCDREPPSAIEGQPL